MDKLALKYHKLGFNCSQCILKAFEEKYKVELSEQVLEMSKTMYAGFGIACMCNVIVAGIMLFGLMLDDIEAKQARIALLYEIQEEYGSLNCGCLRDDEGCEHLISDIAGRIERLIEERK